MTILLTIIINNEDKATTYRICTWSGFFPSMVLFNPHENPMCQALSLFSF